MQHLPVDEVDLSFKGIEKATIQVIEAFRNEIQTWSASGMNAVYRRAISGADEAIAAVRCVLEAERRRLQDFEK